jgi:cardiolipin synthase A/B
MTLPSNLSTCLVLERDQCERPQCALFDPTRTPLGERNLLGPSHTFTQVWTEGDALYEAMLSAMASARHMVRLESFIFADDAIGRRFAATLAARAAAGIQVRVHVDALRVWVDRNHPLLTMMRSAGVQVKLFGSFHLTRPQAFLHRNHRKLLVIDETRAFLGGFNIHRQSSRIEIGESRWRDTHLDLNGPIAALSARIFDTMWQGNPTVSFVGCASAVNGEMIVADASLRCRHRLRCLFAAAFAQSSRRLYLTTPYFVPPQPVEEALADAARRGVDVRVLVPHRSNHPVALAAGQARYSKLLRSGVRIFEYLPRLLHAKTLVVDGQWTTVGTANLDFLSLFTNHELNFVSNDARVASKLEHDFIADLQEAVEINPVAWERRPPAVRIAERFAWHVRRWL